MRALDERLLFAVQAGNLDLVKELLTKGAYINAQAEGWKSNIILDTFTPIMVAIAANRMECFDFLLAKGADIDCSEWMTPLIIAAYHGNSHCVAVLIDNYALVNATDINGRTAMHYACATYNAEKMDVIDQLIKAGGDVNVQDKAGITPMMMAVDTKESPYELLRYLVQQGAEHQIKNHKGQTAIDVFRQAKKKHPDVIKLLKAWETSLHEPETEKTKVQEAELSSVDDKLEVA